MPRLKPPTIRSIADRCAAQPCTLDDRPAKICGRLHDFATIAQLAGPLAVSFAWPTVARILASGGKFSSR